MWSSPAAGCRTVDGCHSAISSAALQAFGSAALIVPALEHNMGSTRLILAESLHHSVVMLLSGCASPCYCIQVV